MKGRSTQGGGPSFPAAGGKPGIGWRAAVLWLLVPGAALLLVDVLSELHDLIAAHRMPDFSESVHLGAEILANVAVAVALVVIFRELRSRQSRIESVESRLGSLRGDFLSLVRQRFASWSLTGTEAEIALLTIKGLCIAEIAGIRRCSESTVKTHLSSIFRKAGVKTRTELVALFLDEVLDMTAGEAITGKAA